jgi:NAD(P)-dependent dehydrogenase (short-subunit alcohol dehydrogenase family)
MVDRRLKPQGTALVTGASRGIGLAHVEALAASGWRVLAVARNPAAAPALADLARTCPDRVRLERADVASAADLEALCARVADAPIDLLLNNAGTFGPKGFPEGMAYQSLASTDYGIWRDIFEVNVLAPFRLTTLLADNLHAAARPLVVMMSSDLGSIANNTQGHSYAYRTSKAALNMIAKGMAVEWPRVITIALAPGWCRTELGGSTAELEPADSVREQQQLFARLTANDSGRFVDRFGADVAW